jgi:integrase/recombinase XerD
LTLWNLIRESAAPVGRLLALDIEQLDLPGRRTKPGSPRSPGSPGSPGSPPPPVRWGPATARLLPMLLLGRTSGPVFITDRRAPAGTPATDRCPVTGRARLSYRRAAEIFAAATSGLDPAGRGWPLLTLRVSRRGGGRCG